MTRRTDVCPRCKDKIRPGLVGCKTCWYLLPQDIRDRINHHFVPKQTFLTATREYHQAYKDAIRWFLDHPVEAELEAQLEASLEQAEGK